MIAVNTILGSRNNERVNVRALSIEGLYEIEEGRKRLAIEEEALREKRAVTAEIEYYEMLERREVKEKGKRTKLLTDKIKGMNLTECNFCREYKINARASECPLIEYENGSCDDSNLRIRKNSKTGKYIIENIPEEIESTRDRIGVRKTL
mgnify:CR=1 FL=1